MKFVFTVFIGIGKRENTVAPGFGRLIGLLFRGSSRHAGRPHPADRHNVNFTLQPVFFYSFL